MSLTEKALQYKTAMSLPSSLTAHAPEMIELGGLGTLMAPSVSNIADVNMDKDTVDALEIGGLGALMSPYIYKLLKR